MYFCLAVLRVTYQDLGVFGCVDHCYMIEVLVLYSARMPSNFDFLLACVDSLLMSTDTWLFSKEK